MNDNMCITSSTDCQTVAEERNLNSLKDTPLSALSKKTLRKLSELLNAKKILRSEEGRERDWRGLASLAKQKCLYDENSISADDPTTKVIQLWCTNSPRTATFACLEQFLGIIDRWDVSDDIYENLVEDSKIYQAKLNNCLVLDADDDVDKSSAKPFQDYGYGSDPNILTTSDVIRAQRGLPPQVYDAFVLYADADLNYASEMLAKLEDDPEYNFKLCMKDRDLLGGIQFEHVVLTQLIEERCKHLIVILTKEFLKSPENKFLVNYTQALQIEHKTRKIVPLLYEESVDIPRMLKIYTHLRYNQGKAGLFNFWSKLANSIQKVNMSANVITLSTLSNGNNTISSTMNKQTCDTPECQFSCIQNQLTKIPHISIIPPEDNVEPIQKERSKIESLVMQNQKNKFHPNDSLVLRNAHSTDQLHESYQPNNAASISDLSTSSLCTEIKKKKKWSSKILKKFFGRSSSKLQQA